MSTFVVSYYVITSFTISNMGNNLSMRTKSITLTISKQKNIKKSKNNNQKAARLRRQRGYNWEDT